jgi:hypothetical protein
MTDSDDRGEKVAHPIDVSRDPIDAEAVVPEDMHDTWNVPRKVWGREPTPVDTLGDITDDDLYREITKRERGSGA